MAYNHGIVVNEKATEVVNINQSSSGLHVVIGVAPINTAKDPYSVTNKPILCSSYKDAIEKLGSSSDFSKFKKLFQFILICLMLHRWYLSMY